MIKRFLKNQSGATAIEYGLIAAVVVLVALSGISLFANNAINMWNNVSNKVGGGS